MTIVPDSLRKFRLKSPLEQFESWQEEYYKVVGTDPAMVVVSREDLSKLRVELASVSRIALISEPTGQLHIYGTCCMVERNTKQGDTNA